MERGAWSAGCGPRGVERIGVAHPFGIRFSNTTPQTQMLKLPARPALTGAALVVVVILSLGACGSGDSSGSTTGPGTQPKPSGDPSFSLGVGRAFACLLNTSGQTSCWGSNEFGQLGTNGSPATSAVSLAVQGPSFSAISSFEYLTCAVTAAGAPMCWGYLPQTSVMFGSTIAKVPAAQASATPLVKITVGYFYACGLDATGAAYCWGLNGYGQLGVGDSTGRASPTAVVGGHIFASIGAGSDHTCGLTAQGVVYCWGSNLTGALGIGSPSQAPAFAPVAVSGGLIFTALAVGAHAVCAIAAGGAAYCWGENNSGELGLGTAGASYVATPTPVVGGLRFKSIRMSRSAAFGQSTCGVTVDNAGYCWGLNESGALGAPVQRTCTTFAADSTGAFPPCNPTPAPVTGLPSVALIVPSYDFTCAVTMAQTVMCWGDNVSGQLGDGTFTSRATPALVTGLTNIP